MLTVSKRGIAVFSAEAQKDLTFWRQKPSWHIKIPVLKSNWNLFSPRYLPPMWKEIAAKANSLTYLSETYYPGCFYARNRYMISQSHGIIYYLEKETGGTAYTVRCAKNSSLALFPITLSSESEW